GFGMGASGSIIHSVARRKRVGHRALKSISTTPTLTTAIQSGSQNLYASITKAARSKPAISLTRQHPRLGFSRSQGFLSVLWFREPTIAYRMERSRKACRREASSLTLE